MELTADFVDAKSRPAQSSFRLMFDVPIEYADQALKLLGGWPLPGESRIVTISLAKTGE